MNSNLPQQPTLSLNKGVSLDTRNTQRRKPFNYGKKSGGARALAHDKELKQFEKDKSPVTVRLLSGRIIEGVISSSDKYTVKIDLKSGNTDTFFKHGIESFGVNERRVKSEAEA